MELMLVRLVLQEYQIVLPFYNLLDFGMLDHHILVITTILTFVSINDKSIICFQQILVCIFIFTELSGNFLLTYQLFVVIFLQNNCPKVFS